MQKQVEKAADGTWGLFELVAGFVNAVISIANSFERLTTLAEKEKS